MGGRLPPMSPGLVYYRVLLSVALPWASVRAQGRRAAHPPKFGQNFICRGASSCSPRSPVLRQCARLPRVALLPAVCRAACSCRWALPCFFSSELCYPSLLDGESLCSPTCTHDQSTTKPP